jgi:hypothetical protein
MLKKKQKISPLKGKPLRYTGQSLDEKIDELINDKGIYYIVTICVLISFIIHEWWRYYRDSPPSPKTITALSVIIISFCVYKLIKIMKEVKILRLGRDGERAVGQYLDLLIEKGYRIYHDIIGDNFNIDHVIVSQKGIFLIETKTFSKPVGKNPIIYFDGSKVYSDCFKMYDDPITQVSASEKWLRTVLKETTGKDFKIRPVIVFPGWFVEMKDEGKKSDIWVLNPKALPKFVENEKDLITKEDMMLASYHISRYIRSK